MAKTQGTSTRSGGTGTWTAEERAAMKEYAAELKRAGGKGAAKAAEDAQACLDKIAEMPEADRVIAERVHAIVTETAPELVVRTWYGMPAYAKDGKTICFFQPKSKFKVRYSTFGFQPDAKVDDGEMFPIAFAVLELTPAAEKRLVELVKQSVS
jgi:uncharacterized protein YdhG (YjbR/CyaY superfamily)